MSGWLLPSADDPVGRADTPIAITVDGDSLQGIAGQTLAGVLLSNGVSAWRTDTRGRPRGMFCGIGSCSSAWPPSTVRPTSVCAGAAPRTATP